MRKLIGVSLIVLFIFTACSAIDKNTYNDIAPTPDNNGSVEASNKEEQTARIEDTDIIIADVVNITDGDTISIRNIDYSYVFNNKTKEQIQNLVATQGGSLNIRFLAVNTPEITGEKDEPFGEEAKDLITNLLSDQKVYIELDSNALFDDYDRLLAHVYNTESVNLQAALLQAGLARVDYLYDEYEYVSTYKELQKQASAASIGVHSIEGYVNAEGNGFQLDNVSTIDNFELKLENLTAYINNLKEMDVFSVIDEVIELNIK